MIELRTPTEIEQMRAAGEFVASALARRQERAAVGVDLLDLDSFAHELIRKRGAESCYLDYAPSFGRGPFGSGGCTAGSARVLRGKPHHYRLRDGDLLSLDFAASVDGWVADAAISLVVGA